MSMELSLHERGKAYYVSEATDSSISVACK